MLRRLLILLILLVIAAGAAALGAPHLGRWYVLARVLPRMEQRLGCELEVQEVGVFFGAGRLRGVTLRCPGDAADNPLARVQDLRLRFPLALLLRGELALEDITVDGLQLNLLRDREGKGSFLELARRLRGGTGAGAPSEGGGVKLGTARVRSGELALVDHHAQLSLVARSLKGALSLSEPSRVSLEQVSLDAARLPHPVTFRLAELRLDRKRHGWPELRLEGGRLRLLPRLELSGIRGTLAPLKGGGAARGAGAPRDPGLPSISILLEGSYGGSEVTLWSAAGDLSLSPRRGKLSLAAKDFNLGRIASLLGRTPVIKPASTKVDGTLELTLEGDLLRFSGGYQLTGLNLFHPMLARSVVQDIAAGVKTEGVLDMGKAHLDLKRFTLNTRGVEATLAGVVERRLGQPYLDLTLTVPPLPCQTVLESIPPSLVPELQGFALKGTFQTNLRAEIDFRKLSELKLEGGVGIGQCKVKEAPEWASAERLQVPFEHQVEVEPDSYKVLLLTPYSTDFTPLATISPYVIKALLTTEDGAFFRHKGFITSQFRAALARNLQQGGFRLGASTITMQMVKNVLLSHQKTLSRKMQELFLTWYLEQNLGKERILEIYLNVIELGPGIYGIGAAARHYFNKEATDINPLEAAFFATLLPSPKRRYVQYCQGRLSEKWDAYTRRVLRRIYQKGHITEAEYTQAAGLTVEFTRDYDLLPVKDCEERVKVLLESWDEENYLRLQKAITEAAPDKLKLYMPPPPHSLSAQSRSAQSRSANSTRR